MWLVLGECVGEGRVAGWEIVGLLCAASLEMFWLVIRGKPADKTFLLALSVRPRFLLSRGVISTHHRPIHPLLISTHPQLLLRL